jgi:hypothetical protein
MKTLMTLLALTTRGAFAGEMAGSYFLEGVREVGSELLLKPDGTFEYMLAYGAADYSAKGTWVRKGDSVILSSVAKDNPPFRLLRSEAVKSPVIRVWVKAPNGRPVEHIDVTLQTPGGEVTERTDNQGVATFSGVRSANAVKMRVRVYQLEAGPYPLSPNENDFTFEINGEAITNVPFKDEPLKINGKDLEMRYWGEDRAMNYRRQPSR